MPLDALWIRSLRPKDPSTGSVPRLSVVIHTCDRIASFERCIDAACAQDIDTLAYEIIVVDEGHDDIVRDLVNALAGADVGAPAICYLRSKGCGSAAARNLGWRTARGALIAFTHDGAMPDPCWLSEGEAAMRVHREWSALCGRVNVPRVRAGRPTDHERTMQRLESAQFTTANAFVRRDALDEVGGFDERFDSASCDDSDLYFRLIRQVGPVGVSRRAVVLHPVRGEPWGACLRQQRNAFFDALLYKKHPRLYFDRIDGATPWNHYVIVGLTGAAPLLLWADSAAAAATAATLLTLLWLQLTMKRLWHTALFPDHLFEMLVTSAVIPFLSVYWRVRGAIRFRVPFL